jgi:hypothetical protein
VHLLLVASVPLVLALTPTRTAQPLLEVAQVHLRSGPPAVIDVNRPRTPDDCDLPIGRNWYGSAERCLAELCAGQNVYNEYVFDAGNRRRRNPCYRQNPTEFEPGPTD